MNKLTTVLEPPSDGPSFLTDSKSTLLVSLPDDFRRFMSAYGGGIINDSICIWQPEHPANGINMQSNIESELAAMRALNKQFPELYNFKKHPDKDGLLPWGRSSDGDTFFGWITTGHSSAWPVATVDDEGGIAIHDMSFTEFLLNMCSNKIPCVELPGDFFDGGLEYQSIGG